MSKTQRDQAPDKWIEVELTEQFARGAEALREALNWHFRDADGRRFVCLEERYQGRKPTVLIPGKALHAKDASKPDRYEFLRRWPPQDHYLSMWNELYPRVAQLQQTRKEAGYWAAFQLAALAAPDGVFPDQMRAFFQSMATGLPEARVLPAMFDATFPGRLAAIRGLFAAAHAPEVLAREPFEGFPSSRGLVSDVVSGLGSYVAPVLLGRMPFVLGMNAARGNGLLLVNFGEPRAGVEDLGYSGLYQLFVPTRYLSRARIDIGDLEPPEIGPEEIDEALRWWLRALDGLLGQLIDPAMFPGSDGIYDPAKHFGYLLTMDRLAATVTGILSYDAVDQFARKMLFFDALDLLEGLGFGDYKKTLSLSKARKTYDTVEQAVPSSVKKIVLSRCSRALSSLEEMQDGLFLTERISNGLLRVKSDSGRDNEIAVESAVAHYLRLVRNSSHSFLKDLQKPFNLSLLASHTGDIPSSLADLPLIYFVKLLVSPETLFARGKAR